jgi:hypothetical protein
MAAARAYKRGEYKGEPSEEIKRIAASMSDDELSDYMTKEAYKREAVYGADKLLEEFKTSPGKASAKAAGIAALSGATGYGIYKYLQKKKKEHKKGDTYPDWVNPVLGTYTGAITAALALAAYNNLPKEAAMYTVGKGSNSLLNPDENPVGTAKPSDPNFTSDKMNMAAVKEAPTGSNETPITGGTPSTPMPPIQGTSVYSNLSSAKKKKSTLEVNPEDWQLDSQVADHKKIASDYVDAMLRKRAQDGGMLQDAKKYMPAYPKVSLDSAQAAVNRAAGVKPPPAYRTPTNAQEAEQMMRMLYPKNNLNTARMAWNKAMDPYSPTSVSSLVSTYKPYLQPVAQKAADKAMSMQPLTASIHNQRAAAKGTNAIATTPAVDQTLNRLAGNLDTLYAARPSSTTSAVSTSTGPASKGLPTKAPNQPLPVTARKNPYKPDMVALNRDLKAMSQPQITPKRPLSDYGTISVRKGVAPKAPTPTKTAGGIDPATYKGELQDVVYGDRHYRLPRYEGKTRDFLKANPLWLKQHGEGDKSMGLVKNYKAIPKKAEELVDELLVKRASCGKSHNSRKKKRSKYAKQYKKNIKNIKKAAAEKSGAPENPFDRIDVAIEMMVKEAKVADEEAFEPVYPYKKGTMTGRIQDQLAPTQKDVSGMAEKMITMDQNLAAVKEDSAAIREQVKDFLEKTEKTKQAFLDPKLLSSAVPGPLAGAAVGGGAGLLLTDILANKPTLTNYLTGAGVGTGLGVLASLAAKKYTRDLATNINKTIADADKNDTNEGTA